MGRDKFPVAEARSAARERRICRYAPEDPVVLKRLLILAIPFIWFLGEAIFDVRMGAVFKFTEVLSSNWILVLFASLVTAAGCYIFYSYRLKHRLLTILDINENGLSIGRLADRAASSVEYLVSWKEIGSVEEKIKADKAGHKLGRGRGFGAGFSKDHSDDHSQGWLSINSKLDVSFRLTLDNAFRWISRESLIDGLIKYAPQAELKLSDHSADHNSPLTRYTGLWLENLDAAGKRKRVVALAPADILQEGKYKIIKQLGQGGQGRAYLATTGDTHIQVMDREHKDGKVVLKEYVLPIQISATEQRSESGQHQDYFTSEAKILAMLNHPNIVQLFDCFQEDFRGYLVLEYVRGDSIRDLIGRKGTLSELEALPLALCLSDALSYLQSFSPPIIHGDISPENAMIDSLDRTKLIDFTVAHQFKEERQTTLFGKAGFLAPEQYKGYNLPASEIYALGATIYFMLSGQDPQPLEPVSLHESGVAVSDQFNSIVSKAMAMELANRYQSAAELHNDLLELAQAFR
jgi:serine/threonine protein kinase